jgi:hypothetical protein
MENPYPRRAICNLINNDDVNVYQYTYDDDHGCGVGSD